MGPPGCRFGSLSPFSTTTGAPPSVGGGALTVGPGVLSDVGLVVGSAVEPGPVGSGVAAPVGSSVSGRVGCAGDSGPGVTVAPPWSMTRLPAPSGAAGGSVTPPPWIIAESNCGELTE